MYVSHFGFYRQPFQSADAGRAFFVSESIQTILPQLLHALRSDLGIAVLTGVPGSGKTSLLRHIQQQVSNEGRAIVCSGASLGTSADLFSVLLEAARRKAGTAELLGNSTTASSLQETRNVILGQIRRTAELWGPVLLLIDDAQLVPLAVLNELRACTEEAWNGRDLVRCLVSAPIAFEEQLARAEYAEFGRRIRCHAFLQPLKSSESLRFLKEQIEIVGGRLSRVFTAAALELISTAAAGIPRCLSLLADESLVVAMQNGEVVTSENSVRRALRRLQHLQYNWNASPVSDIADNAEEVLPQISAQHLIQSSGSTGVLEFGGHGVDQSASLASTLTTDRQAKSNYASLAPGVFEFGGPAIRSSAKTDVPPADVPAVAASKVVTAAEFDAEICGDVHELKSSSGTPANEEPLVSSDCDIQGSSFVEFGTPESHADETVLPTPATSVESGSLFEVGRRFYSESSSESVSVEDFEDSEIVSLLHSECASEDLDGSDSVRLPADHPDLVRPGTGIEGLEIYWIDGNAHVSIPEPAADDIDAGILEEVSGQANLRPVTDEYATAAAKFHGSSDVNTTVYTPTTDFVDLGDSRYSVRTPVFDRYTWIALGREIQPGMNSNGTSTIPGFSGVSGVVSLIQADMPFELMVQRPRSKSIDQIPVTRTTDDLLMDQIRRNLLDLESDSFGAIQQEPEPTSQTLAVPALKIWHDGQLIFPDATDTESVNAPDSKAPEPMSSQSATPSITTSQIEAGGFFTLPISVDRIEWDLRALDSADDADVFPIVETLAGLRAEMRQFQQTGRTNENERSGAVSGDPESHDVPGGDFGADDLVSRAKRRLNEQNSQDESTIVPLQLGCVESRPLRTVGDTINAAHWLQPEEIAETTPQLGRLFTRLWASRRRDAGEIENR